MKKAQLSFTVLFVLFSTFIFAQNSKFNIIGTWNSVDSSNNENKTIFSKDGYVTMTINGEEIDGRNFIIHGGPNDGEKAELKYAINLNTNPIQIDLIALKNNEEKGRLKGILIASDSNHFTMAMHFDGTRPENINEEEKNNIIVLTRIE